MADDRRPGELRTVAIPEDDNLLEQLVSSVKRIEFGLDATYAAVVGLDELARTKAIAAADPMNINTIREVRERYAYACNAQMPVVTISRQVLLGVLLLIDPSAVPRR